MAEVKSEVTYCQNCLDKNNFQLLQYISLIKAKVEKIKFWLGNIPLELEAEEENSEKILEKVKLWWSNIPAEWREVELEVEAKLEKEHKGSGHLVWADPGEFGNQKVKLEGLLHQEVKLEPPVYQEECDDIDPLEDNYVGIEWSAGPLSEMATVSKGEKRKDYKKLAKRIGFVCATCTREFTSKHNLKRHSMAGCKVKETWHIWCNYHQLQFTDLKAAKIKTCARCSLMYRCNICNNETTSRSGILRHYKKQHTTQPPAERPQGCTKCCNNGSHSSEIQIEPHFLATAALPNDQC